MNNLYEIHNHFLANVGNTPSNDESEEYWLSFKSLTVIELYIFYVASILYFLNNF
jgi:hypothetical protein